MDDRVAVLMVDDRPENLMVLEGVLASEDLELVKANSGQEALRLLLQREFAVILLDVMMPVMDGFETAGLIRERARSQHTPIVFITAENPDDARVLQGYDLGAVDFIFKPIRPKILKGKIRAFVDLYRKTVQLRRFEQLERERQLEAKIQQAQKMESLATLAGGVAHDFNNLLQVIIGNLGLARMKLPADSPALDVLGHSQEAAQRAAELTKQMLAYSGKGQFVIQPLDLNRLVEDMAPLLQSSVTRKAALRLQLPPTDAPIEGDATQVRQVVMNLIANASDALGDEPGEIRVATGVVRADRAYLRERQLSEDLQPGDYAYLEVADDGCGMDPATLANIFDPFFTTKFTGRGLGLAAVLGIVRGHHGAIRVESEPGKGTSVHVLLPARAAASAPGGALPAQRPATRGGRTVLVVDDEQGVRGVAKMMLEDFGYRVLTANDGREGVAAFERHADEIAVVLLDMTMPEMNGEEAFHAIRRIRPDARVILSSGYNQEEATRAFVGSELAGFLQKPYQLATLREKVREVIGTAYEPERR